MSDLNLDRYRTDFIAFVDDFIHVNELGKPFRLHNFQREILGAAFEFDENGRLLYDTIIYSTIKKSGKTFINDLVVTWWAFTQEAPNEIEVCANDLEQAQSRVFTGVCDIIRNNPALAGSAIILQKQITLSNATVIKALASDASGSAGSNHGLTSWDELWGYVSEGSVRLYEELTPVPTRTNSIRFITTYAGWEGESKLLWDLYKQAVGPEEHPEGQGERIHPDLPVYVNLAARVFAYWDHTPRLPWQTPEYYASQKKNLRPGTFTRLHENRWTTAVSVFLTPELWEPCVEPEHTPLPPVISERIPLFVGVDAGIKSDNAAVVAVYWQGDRLAIGAHRIWRPSKEHPLDIEATIEAYLEDLNSRYLLEKVLCDPYQLHRTITTLKAKGLPIEEFPQTQANTTRMGQGLWDLLQSRNLLAYPSEELRDQALATVAVENPRGWRIAKEKASRKIDAIVALSMAAVAAVAAKADAPSELVQRTVRLWAAPGDRPDDLPSSFTAKQFVQKELDLITLRPWARSETDRENILRWARRLNLRPQIKEKKPRYM